MYHSGRMHQPYAATWYFIFLFSILSFLPLTSNHTAVALSPVRATVPPSPAVPSRCRLTADHDGGSHKPGRHLLRPPLTSTPPLRRFSLPRHTADHDDSNTASPPPLLDRRVPPQPLPPYPSPSASACNLLSPTATKP